MSSKEYSYRTVESDPEIKLEINVSRIISPVIRKEIYCVNVKSDHIAGQLKHRSHWLLLKSVHTTPIGNLHSVPFTQGITKGMASVKLDGLPKNWNKYNAQMLCSHQGYRSSYDTQQSGKINHDTFTHM